jgi:hypothetical protein
MYERRGEMSEPDGCWFWVDCRVPEGDRKMSALCGGCRTAKHPGVGSYWDFRDGCGPWDVVCGECGAVLHKHVAPGEEFLAAVAEKIDGLMANPRSGCATESN